MLWAWWTVRNNHMGCLFIRYVSSMRLRPLWMRASCSVVEESVWREGGTVGDFPLENFFGFFADMAMACENCANFSRPLWRFRTRWDVQTALGGGDRETNGHHNRETGETETGDKKRERKNRALSEEPAAIMEGGFTFIALPLGLMFFSSGFFINVLQVSFCIERKHPRCHLLPSRLTYTRLLFASLVSGEHCP